MGNLLEVDDLEISLSADQGTIDVIQSVSFTLAPGKTLALVGESGCGKSVTAASILRLLPRELNITRGSIRFCRPDSSHVTDIAKLAPRGRAIRDLRGNDIAMIFQEPMSSFSPLYTIGNQIGEVIQLHRKVSKKEARDITADLLDKVGIPHPLSAVDRYPHEYSGGMRQRAMIAKALSCDPALLIADEPTTALDVTIQAQIIELMQELQQEFHMAIIFITHDLGVVAQVSDEVYIMYAGRIVEQGSVGDIFHNAKHPYTRDLLHAVPRLGNIEEELVAIEGNVPGLYDMPAGCRFHPRCASFMADTCDARKPDLKQVGEAHSVECHLYA
ncbi:MAG: ABC transporter ATP-binding protein [Gammaproteobacteria bacterium]|nr:MAG: ABC transporter ATP-binding protein [Gammaproteobacteria bacterium]